MQKNYSNNLVSVIIPSYNRAWCLKNAIDSVLSQSYENYELIVVDDGSTDLTKDILDEYVKKHKNIRVLFQENKGVSAARNNGILNSKGDFISFLDSDDLWEREKLKSQIDFFNENKDIYVCQTQEIWVRNNKRVNPKFRHKKPVGDIFIPSLSLCLVSPSAVMMKRSFFDKVGLFDETMAACEDYDLWLRSSLIFEFGLVNEAYVIKNGGHDDQLSSMPLLDKLRIFSIDKLLKKGIDDKIKRLAAIDKLMEKCEIYLGGCEKRSKWEEYDFYNKLARFWEERK